jgi:putative hydrolase of the HAD superfamily
VAPLLLLDLDNTLADRATAFEAVALELAALWAPGDPQAAAFLVTADEDGFCPRPVLAQRLIEHFKLGAAPEQLTADMRSRLIAALPPLRPAVVSGLQQLRELGWRLALVTNGDGPTQMAKLERLGARELFDAICISGALGMRKPDPEIFQRAASDCEAELSDGWMIGDGLADVGGARNAHIPSVWLRRGRIWTHTELAPDQIADSLEDALELVARAHGVTLTC